MGGACAGARRVWEDVDGRQLRFFANLHRSAEVVVRLAGEAGYGVGGDGDAFDGAPYPADGGEEFGGVVSAAHPRQNRVAAALERDVEVRTQARVRRPQRKQPVRYVARLERGYANPRDVRPVQKRAQQGG